MKRSLRNRPHWNLSEDWGSNTGAWIWLQSAATSKKNVPKELWILEEIGCHQHEDDPPCKSGTVQGKCQQEKPGQGQRGRGTLKRQKFGISCHPKPELKYGIRNRRLRQQLRSKREFTKIYRKTTGLEITKQIAKSAVGLRKIRNCTLWRGRPPLKWKKRPHTE
jgi:hypothetical protein